MHVNLRRDVWNLRSMRNLKGFAIIIEFSVLMPGYQTHCRFFKNQNDCVPNGGNQNKVSERMTWVSCFLLVTQWAKRYLAVQLVDDMGLLRQTVISLQMRNALHKSWITLHLNNRVYSPARRSMERSKQGMSTLSIFWNLGFPIHSLIWRWARASPPNTLALFSSSKHNYKLLCRRLHC